MRLPNGYGSVVHLKGNRRKPYLVRKTAGYDAKGHPKYQIIGYTATKEEGYRLLADFNHAPWNTDLANITFAELYVMWNEQRNAHASYAVRASIEQAYSYSTALHGMVYRNIRAYQMQDCINRCDKSYSTKANIKTLFNKLDRYAFEMDIISKRYSDLLTMPPKTSAEKRPFTEEEIALLWDHSQEYYAACALILIYTGWRITELLTMSTENVDTDQWTMRGGIKTKAGKNRVVPIHTRIRPLILSFLQNSTERFLPVRGARNGYEIFKTGWKKWQAEIGMDHTIHETRHTFRSRLDSADANQRSIDLLMGHSSGNVGVRVYTHKTLDELRAVIELVK